MQKFSVLLLYPQDAASFYGETYYALVESDTRKGAVRAAQEQCVEDNDIGEELEYAASDLEEVLVLEGWHDAI